MSTTENPAKNPNLARLGGLPPKLLDLLEACPGWTIADSYDDLIALSVRDNPEGYHDVYYDLPDGKKVHEARVCKVRNGVAANYVEPYMRRRDPDCMVIGDQGMTEKPTYEAQFGKPFAGVRDESFAWLRTQELAVLPFYAGLVGQGMPALAVVPANAGFFALGLALLQGFIPVSELPEDFKPRAFIFGIPPFRHTHFGGKQIVVHNRQKEYHELFSYNLYPGPSAKKGVYGVLLTLGEQERWLTIHGASVEAVTPYENRMCIVHEGASGGGKSEMLEHVHRQRDGSLLLGKNVLNEEERQLELPRSCKLHPVTDDMALCVRPGEGRPGHLTLRDAEDAWFVRVNHINRYGTDPNLEELTIRPPLPLLFLNIEATPGSTALIWDHIEDEPGQPCPNPRVILPRSIVPNVVNEEVEIDVRSFGVRCPACTREKPTYGIIGLFHVLPPALAWLWRLVSPRGHANPSIVDTEGMTSEGVGSYWPFATGRRVEQANLLLRQVLETPEVRYILTPNQHIGAWATSFMPQWITREYLARRRGARFTREKLKDSRCPLLGYTLGKLNFEGQNIGPWFFEVDKQPEVGEEAYDAGAKILREFFERELAHFRHDDLEPVGQKIIDCCLQGGSADDMTALMEIPVFDVPRR